MKPLLVSIIPLIIVNLYLELPAQANQTALSENDSNLNNQNAPTYSQAGIEIDSVFIHLCKYIRSEGFQLVEKQKRYPFKRDTLYFDKIDSILIYKYNKDDVIKFYYNPFELGSVRNLGWPGEDTMVTHVINFIEYIERATSCAGIAYGWGDCFVDVWSFNSRLAAAIACDLYNNAKLYVFPKTWNFAINVSDKLYVFHGRYSRASYVSKEHFEYFINNIRKRKSII